MKKYLLFFAVIVGSANSSAAPLEIYGTPGNVDALDPDVKREVTIVDVNGSYDVVVRTMTFNSKPFIEKLEVYRVIQEGDKYINAKRKEVKNLSDHNNYLSATLKREVDTNTASIAVNKQEIGDNKADADARITRVDSKVAKNKRSIDINKSDADTQITRVDSKVDANKSLIDANKVSADREMAANKAEADTRITNMGRDVASNTSSIAANKAEADTRITNMGRDVASNTSSIAANKTEADTRITNMGRDVASNTSSIAANKAEA